VTAPAILDHGGAPTINLTANGNPTPTAFLRQKFRLLRHLARTGALDDPASRREATRYEPFLFALIYMPQYFVLNTPNALSQNSLYGGITLSQFHVDAFLAIEEWAIPSTKTRQDRDGWVAPRESGKSTIFFTVGPLWAAAHQHKRFVAAFSDSDDQVQKHLAKFHEQVDNNKTLQEDFPDLCAPARRANGNAVNDNKNAFNSANGFTFEAHTIDGKIVGLVNNENARPDLIILDDIEPSEDKYSQDMKLKGVNRLRDKILYLNEFARVILVGTVTMAGSIMHDVVQSLLNPGSIPAAPTPSNPHRFGNLVPDWIREQNFRAHYYPALSVDPKTGQLQSLWPEKWPVEELAPRLGTNDFMKNMQNNPVGDGEYWEQGDILYSTLPAPTRTILSIDPAVTATASSDYTGLAVIRYQPPSKTAHLPVPVATAPPPPTDLDELLQRRIKRRGRPLPADPRKRAEYIASLMAVVPDSLNHPPAAPTPTGSTQARCEVAWATRVKMKPQRLKNYVLTILERFPEIDTILIETNQGHDFVSEPYEELPVRLLVKTQSEPKDTRIARLAQYYKSFEPKVTHADHFVPLEEEMYAYPQTANDDTVDAVATGVQYFLFKDPKHRPKSRRRPRKAPTDIRTYVRKPRRTASRRAA
jgi:hypothetical protein